MPSLTLAIHPIHDKDRKGSKNKGKLRERHLQGDIELPLISLNSASGQQWQDVCQV
jgi:hypothetical protein